MRKFSISLYILYPFPLHPQPSTVYALGGPSLKPDDKGDLSSAYGHDSSRKDSATFKPQEELAGSLGLLVPSHFLQFLRPAFPMKGNLKSTSPYSLLLALQTLCLIALNRKRAHSGA